jgi:hypothetical protein
LPLYGGGAPDIAACAATTTFAASAGVLRIVADRHHASDVLVGALIGAGAGFALPMALSYGVGSGSGVQVMVLPPGEPGVIGVGAHGQF